MKATSKRNHFDVIVVAGFVYITAVSPRVLSDDHFQFSASFPLAG